MPLAALDQFGLVKASTAGYRRRLDALTVETTRRRLLMATGALTNFGPQRIVDAFPGAGSFPVPKVAVHTLPLWVLSRQHPPLDAADDDIQNRVDDLAHIQAARSSARFGRWDQFLDNAPLAVSQIGRVSLLCHNSNVYQPSADSRYFSNSFLEANATRSVARVFHAPWRRPRHEDFILGDRKDVSTSN